jgi:hypothetical protein
VLAALAIADELNILRKERGDREELLKEQAEGVGHGHRKGNKCAKVAGSCIGRAPGKAGVEPEANSLLSGEDSERYRIAGSQYRGKGQIRAGKSDLSSIPNRVIVPKRAESNL